MEFLGDSRPEKSRSMCCPSNPLKLAEPISHMARTLPIAEQCGIRSMFGENSCPIECVRAGTEKLPTARAAEKGSRHGEAGQVVVGSEGKRWGRSLLATSAGSKALDRTGGWPEFFPLVHPSGLHRISRPVGAQSSDSHSDVSLNSACSHLSRQTAPVSHHSSRASDCEDFDEEPDFTEVSSRA
jgi:hypothetical protein